MAELSATLLSRLRRKINDPDGNVFTTDELNDVYTEADSDFDRTLLTCYEEIWMDAARFVNYSIGMTSVQKQQAFANLEKVIGVLRTKVDRGRQVSIVGIRNVPPRDKDEPA